MPLHIHCTPTSSVARHRHLYRCKLIRLPRIISPQRFSLLSHTRGPVHVLYTYLLYLPQYSVFE